MDGAHRSEAYRLESREEIDAEYWKDEVLDKKENLEELRIISLEKNIEHGLQLKESDIEFQCERIIKARPIEKLTGVQKYLAGRFHLTEGRISQMVGELVNKRKATRDSVILKMSLLGWKQQEIADVVGLSVRGIQETHKNFNIKEIVASYQQGKLVCDIASYHNIDQTTIWSIVLKDKPDLERLNLLGFIRKIEDKETWSIPKVYDVWNYTKCDTSMGQQHPGQIPGQIVLNTLYYYTEPDDLVVDLMAGGGVTNDACLLLGRKCYSYDVNPKRKDILQYDYLDGLPEKAKKADLIFLDPPYYKKKEDEYGEKSISALDRDKYLDAIDKLAVVCKGHKVAFLMGKYYDYDNPEDGIFMADYVNIFEKHGFVQIDELSVNQPPPQGGQYAVGQAKKKHRMEIRKRDLVIFGVKQHE